MADTSPPSPAARPALPALTLAIMIAGAVTLWRLAELFGDPFNLSFDEAQYWAWAQQPAFGYFSKPPMIAWAIWATTAIGGDAESWVRLSATLSHFVTALALFFAGRALVSERVGLWASIVWVTLPAVFVSAMVVTTDAYLLMFWALALHASARAVQTDGARWWGLLGVWVGLGLLSKYAMVFFLVSLVLYLAWSRRDLLRRPGPWAAAALGVAIYLPNLWWNWTHGMASYRHTGENANLGGSLFNPGELGEFLASQFGVFGPLLFGVLLVIVFARFRSTTREDWGRFLLAFTLPVLAAITVQAFLSRANANWAATAYPAAAILVSAWLLERGRWRRVLGASVALHVLAGVVLYNMSAAAGLVGIELNAKTDLKKRLRGWDEVGAWVQDLAVKNPDLTLLFDDRKTMATLLYYARPQAWDSVIWNPRGHVLNHYELTTSMDGREGDDFLFVTRGTAEHLAPSFEGVETLGILRLPIHPKYTLEVRAYRLTGFKGYPR